MATKYSTDNQGRVHAYNTIEESIIELRITPDESMDDELSDDIIELYETFNTLDEFFEFIAKHYNEIKKVKDVCDISIHIYPKDRKELSRIDVNRAINGKAQTLISLDISNMDNNLMDTQKRLQAIHYLSNMPYKDAIALINKMNQNEEG